MAQEESTGMVTGSFVVTNSADIVIYVVDGMGSPTSSVGTTGTTGSITSTGSVVTGSATTSGSVTTTGFSTATTVSTSTGNPVSSTGFVEVTTGDKNSTDTDDNEDIEISYGSNLVFSSLFILMMVLISIM